MKIFFMLMIALSSSAFASDMKVGENASPEYKSCLAEDKCPSQRCANSCAMINSTQFKSDRNTAVAPKKRGGKSDASAQ